MTKQRIKPMRASGFEQWALVKAIARCSLLALSCLLASTPAMAQNKTNVAHQQYLGLVADPSNVVKGSAFYRSDLDTLRFRALSLEIWDGTVWRPITDGAKTIHGIRFVNPALWPGGTVTADIDAAISDCAGATCLVVYPTLLGSGEATSIPENVTVLDLRQTLMTPPTAGAVPGLLLHRRLTSAPGVNFRNLTGLYLDVDAADGGQYNSTSKNAYQPLFLNLTGRTQGEHQLIHGRVNGYGIGDALFLSGLIYGYGAKNVTGTSQPTAEFAEVNVRQGDLVFTAQTLNNEAPSATVIEYTADANESVLGERAVINISRTTVTGTVTGIVTDTVTFSGAPDWTTLSPSPVGQYFKINSEDVTIGGTSTGHWYRVIAVISATVLQLETTYGLPNSDLATSGAYTLAQGAEITGFDTSTNTLTIEANSYDWAAADNLISPPMPLLNFRGLNMFFTKRFKTGTSRAIDLNNAGPFAWDVGLLIEGAPAAANAFRDGITITAKVNDGIRLDSATVGSTAIRLANGHKVRWGTDADFFFDAGGFFSFNKRASIVAASAATPILRLQHAASPSADHLLIVSSASATIFGSDSNGVVNIKPSFGTGLKLDPNTGPTVAAQGTNTNIVLDLITKGTGTVRVNAQASTGTGGFQVFDGAATPKLMFSVSSTGVGNNGAAFKHARVTTGSVGAGASAAVTLTWTTAFADANYTVTCSLMEATASTSTLRLHHLESVAAGSVVVRVVNDDGANPRTGTLHCTAVHD